LASAGIISLALSLGAARSAPLPPEDCQKLSAERSALMAAGIPEEMAKGPEWAKANLPLQKLAEIRRFITVDEQLAFRCGMSRFKLDVPDDEAASDAGAKGATAPAKKAAKAPAKSDAARPSAKAKTPSKSSTAARKPAASTPPVAKASPAPRRTSKPVAKRPAPSPPSKAPVLSLTPGSGDSPK
jgi:hypothetical protein